MSVVIECPDGTTYIQSIADDFYSLIELKEMIGPDYWIVELIDTTGGY